MNGLFHNDIGVFSKALEISPKGGTASPRGLLDFKLEGYVPRRLCDFDCLYT